ncbi:hypothetical protein F511_45534 [Dorcoceras hygrometricum]|uniref:Uncharacterized protein n=1 Tax=Dorcoceras hygrometricum TaxID=472368 RepID=A0A2Z7A2Y4_9LAMI|nr:hypothetical protein F511_45534 [Dorcoceras hygrometricum]
MGFGRHSGHLRAQVAQVGRQVRVPPCAHHRTQRARTVTDQLAQRPQGCVRRVRAHGSDQFHEEIGTSTVGSFGLLILSTTGIPIPSPVYTRKLDEDFMDGISSPERSERDFRRRRRRRWRQTATAAAAAGKERRGEEE